MQTDMAKAQEELAGQTVEASAGGGMVKVTASGAGEILTIKIAAEAIDPDDPEMLEDIVLAAVNEALRNSNDLQQSKLGGAMGDLGGLGLVGVQGALGSEQLDLALVGGGHRGGPRGRRGSPRPMAPSGSRRRVRAAARRGPAGRAGRGA